MSPIIFLGAGGALALILLLIGIVVTIRNQKSDLEQRITDIADYQPQETRQKIQQSTPLTDWLNQRMAGSSMGDNISKTLARADLKMKPGEYIALIIIAAVGFGMVAWFIGGQNILLGAVGMIAGTLWPGFYVKGQQKKRLMKFNDQLPDMLGLMVNGLRAGYSTMQAMEAVSREMPAPICDEFRRVVQEMQLGVSMQAALENLLRRIPSDDLDLVITAVNVQREVGGNLAEIMDTITYTIRERIRIKGEIRVLTSQVMYSGRFLAMMPFILTMILYVLNREYMSEFIKPENFPCGYITLGIALLLIIGGFFAMNKLGDIEI